MADAAAFPARGRIIEVREGMVVFAPSDTTYRMHLASPRRIDLPAGSRVQGLIRLDARKVWTVPSGGNFIAPIYGPPRTIQGRVRHLDEQFMVLHCGTPIIVRVPAEEWGIDLANGPIALQTMVNVAALPGATFELVEQPAAVRA
jgi:hypothetical protein